MSTIDASSTLSAQDFFSTTLSGAISASDTVIGLNAVPTSSEGFLVLELGTANQEIVYYNSKTSNTVTCPSVARGRGVGGTTAVGHSSGASAKMVVNSDYFKELQNGNANTGMQTYFDESFFDYTQTGCVWTGDSLGSNRNASMTAGVVYINGKRLVVALVTARTFTASKDTYIDVTLTTGSNAGTLVYTEVTNNAASPALAANSIRIGIIITGATTIAAAGSINQGQTDRVLPIASSVPYTVTDSLGNIIYNTNPSPRLIGYRQILTTFASAVAADVTGLNVLPVIVPAGRAIRIRTFQRSITNSATANVYLTLKEGSTSLGQVFGAVTAGNSQPFAPEVVITPSAGLHTYKVNLDRDSGTATINADASNPAFISVELV